MDNQQDQLGATTPDNAGQNSQNPASIPNRAEAASGATASSRKPASGPTAQSSNAPTDASQTTANAGAERQGEGQQTNEQEGTVLDTALNSGKKWIEDSGVLNGVNQLPQVIKDLGNRAAARVGDLTTTQKVVGGAILAVGLGWLATRKGKSSTESSPYNYGRQRDPGSYGRRRYGYQAPDASTSRPTASGATSRTDSGAPYGNSGSRYGSSASSNTGINAGSGRTASPSASAHTDHGAQASDSFRAKSDDSRIGE